MGTINEGGLIESDGGGGCSGGSIFFCCDKFVNKGTIRAIGGSASSFCAKGGNGRIAIYCNQFENNGTIQPKPYQHVFEDEKEEKTVYEYGMEIVEKRDTIKMNVIYHERN